MSTGWPYLGTVLVPLCKVLPLSTKKRLIMAPLLKHDYLGKNGSTLTNWKRFSKWFHCGAISAPLFFSVWNNGGGNAF